MNANTITEEKRALRKELNHKLSNLSLDRHEVSDRVWQNLKNLPQLVDAITIGAYIDFRTELPTRYFIPSLFNLAGKPRRIAVPYCVDHNLDFYYLNPPKVDAENAEPRFLDLTPQAYGILEPSEQTRALPERFAPPYAFDAMLVPGLAFTPDGERLGRGAGYYDRFLTRLRPNVPLIGLAYDEQILPRVPTDVHDRRVDVVVTATRVYYP